MCCAYCPIQQRLKTDEVNQKYIVSTIEISQSGARNFQSQMNKERQVSQSEGKSVPKNTR